MRTLSKPEGKAGLPLYSVLVRLPDGEAEIVGTIICPDAAAAIAAARNYAHRGTVEVWLENICIAIVERR
jgi:hypothetical protein